jgi:hypothetical protein
MRADEELGHSWWSSATGAIVGVVFAMGFVIIMYGIDDYEDAMGVPFFLFTLALGAIGAFFGSKKEQEHFKKVALRTEQILREQN